MVDTDPYKTFWEFNSLLWKKKNMDHFLLFSMATLVYSRVAMFNHHLNSIYPWFSIAIREKYLDVHPS